MLLFNLPEEQYNYLVPDFNTSNVTIQPIEAETTETVTQFQYI